MNEPDRQRVRHLRTDYVQSREIAEKRFRKRRKGLIRRLITFCLVVILAGSFMFSSLLSQSRQLAKADDQKTTLEKQIAKAQDKENVLKKRIRLLHDKNYIGQLVRKNYLLSKKDEIIFSKPGQSSH
jgi:cell division protein DivIC